METERIRTFAAARLRYLLAAIKNPDATIVEDARGHVWRAWLALTPAEKDMARDVSDLTPQLVGWEGWRAECDDEGRPGHKRRFIVGRSAGWRPCHLELANKRSHDGDCARKVYSGLRFIERVR